MRVLVTGAAGSIGQVVTVGLEDRGHDVVGLDRVPAPDGTDIAWHTGRLRGRRRRGRRLRRRVRGVQPRRASSTWPATPARRRCPTRSARTSSPPPRCSTRWSSTASAGSSTPAPTTPSATPRAPACPTAWSRSTCRPRPDTFYGVAKVAAEAVMSLYADRYGLDVVSCRIGSFRPEPRTVRHLATWLSHDDCVRMVEAALTAPAPGLRGPLRHLRQHPRLVGPGPRPRARLRPAGRRRGLGRPSRRPPGRPGRERPRRRGLHARRQSAPGARPGLT